MSPLNIIAFKISKTLYIEEEAQETIIQMPNLFTLTPMGHSQYNRGVLWPSYCLLCVSYISLY